MSAENKYVLSLLGRLKELREHAGLTMSQLEEKLLLGPGWCYVSR